MDGKTTSLEDLSEVADRIRREEYQFEASQYADSFLDSLTCVDIGYKEGSYVDCGTDNWNERYFSCLSKAEGTRLQKIEKFSELQDIHRDFVQRATRYAKTIISEYFISPENKTIKVAPLGGRNGIKFKAHGILFKLAKAQKNSPHFQGDDEFAAKAMGHELKGANAYFKSRKHELYVALQILVDYKGFRMHCQALLDIDDSTLLVGSSDGAKTVHNDDENLRKIMKNAAAELNLREHVIKQTEVYSACDVEGHRGKTSLRYYLVDLARVFPPEHPEVLDSLNPYWCCYNVGDSVYFLMRQGAQSVPGLSHGDRITIKAVHTRFTGPQMERWRGFEYDVVNSSGAVFSRVPAELISPVHRSIYWKFLRPEFVKNRGQQTIQQFNKGLSQDWIVKAIKDFFESYYPLINHEDGVEVLDWGMSSNPRSTPHVVVLSDALALFGGTARTLSHTVRDRPTLDLGEPSASATLAERNSDSGAYDAAPPGDDDFSTLLTSERTSGRCTPTNNQSFPEFDEYSTAPPDTYECSSDEPSKGVLRFKPEAPVEEAELSSSSVVLPVASSTNSNDAKSENTSDRSGLDPPPLCSDTFSSFSSGDPQRATQEREIKAATENLVFSLMPALVDELLRKGHPYLKVRYSITDFMHFSGVNIRYCGYLRFVLLETLDRNEKLRVSSQSSPSTEERMDGQGHDRPQSVSGIHLPCNLADSLPEDAGRSEVSGDDEEVLAARERFLLQSDLLKECVCRTLKGMLRRHLRHLMFKYKTSSEQTLMREVASFLNLVTGSHSQSSTFWKEVKSELVKRFGCISLRAVPHHILAPLMGLKDNSGDRLAAWTDQSSKQFDLWNLCMSDPRFLYSVVETLCSISGIRLSHSCKKQLKSVRQLLDTFLLSLTATRSDSGEDPKSLSSKSVRMQRRSSSAPFRADGFEGPETVHRRCYHKFVCTDIQELIPVVKHMHHLDYVEGMVLLLRAEEEQETFRDSDTTIRLVRLAVEKFRSARRAIPDDLGTSHALADAHQLHAVAMLHLKSWYKRKLDELLSGSVPGPDVETTRAELEREKDKCAQLSEQSFASYLALSDWIANTRCSKLKLTYKDDVLGMVIELAYYDNGGTSSNKTIREVIVRRTCYSLTYFLQFIDYHQKQLEDSSVLQKYRFIPLVIDSEHIQRVEPLLKAEFICFESPSSAIFRANQLRVSSPIRVGSAFARHAADCSDFEQVMLNPETGFDVISRIMNAIVVSFCKKDVTSGKTMSNDDIIGYMRFHHMLLHFSRHDPRWRELANNRVEEFVQHEESRRKKSGKKSTPDLGRFLINLLISDRSWESISVPFIEESLSRQVSWILLPQNSQPESKQQKPPDIDNDAPFLNDRSRGHFNPRHMLEDGSNKTPLASDVSAVPTQTTNSFDLKKYHPELAHLERDEISTYRLFTTFESTLVSSRLLMFQVYFLELVRGVDVTGPVDKQHHDLEVYNSSRGYPTSARRTNLTEQFRAIIDVKDYEGFFDRISVRRSPSYVTVLLRNAIRKSARSKYVNISDFSTDQENFVSNDSTSPNLSDLAAYSEEWNRARQLHAERLANGEYQSILDMKEEMKQKIKIEAWKGGGFDLVKKFRGQDQRSSPWSISQSSRSDQDVKQGKRQDFRQNGRELECQDVRQGDGQPSRDGNRKHTTSEESRDSWRRGLSQRGHPNDYRRESEIEKTRKEYIPLHGGGSGDDRSDQSRPIYPRAHHRNNVAHDGTEGRGRREAGGKGEDTGGGEWRVREYRGERRAGGRGGDRRGRSEGIVGRGGEDRAGSEGRVGEGRGGEGGEGRGGREGRGGEDRVRGPIHRPSGVKAPRHDNDNARK